MKKNYIVLIVTIMSLFSMILLTEGAFAEEKSRATSNVGIQFYGEYPATQETTDSTTELPKTSSEPKKPTGKLPSTGEKSDKLLPWGMLVLAVGLLIINKKRTKQS